MHFRLGKVRFERGANTTPVDENINMMNKAYDLVIYSIPQLLREKNLKPEGENYSNNFSAQRRNIDKHACGTFNVTE